MAELMTSEQLAARTARAVDAAATAGRELGLAVTDPVVLHDMFSVVVHLAPEPVVVRVPTVLPPNSDPDALVVRQQRELDVVAWLADRGFPVVPPSPLVPREPVRRSGFSMTFWQFVAQDDSVEVDYVENARRIADLHAALRDYPGELPYLAAAEPQAVTDCLAALQEHPELLDPVDLDRARREWEVLHPLVRSRAEFERAFPGVDLQPIHGDAPAVNLLVATDGPRHADFELVALGPVEWDLAFLGPDCAAAYDAAAQRSGLRRLDERVLRFANAVGAVRALSCFALVPQLPALAEALTPALENWRSTPFAGGLFD